ncbi:hypothetical protein RR46_03894 [Papilio xuthus]|uniref:Uncharacterized protein n=1 Tax=Papilio xuthus TaxID=66420 RepID=A0A194Q3E0_PAPXU|nr:hypothetical protein RR46_03894 [Papilio xuthus]
MCGAGDRLRLRERDHINTMHTRHTCCSIQRPSRTGLAEAAEVIGVAAPVVRAKRQAAELGQVAQLGVQEGAGGRQAQRRTRHARRTARARVQRARQPSQLVVRYRGRAGRCQPPPQRTPPEHHMPPPASRARSPPPRATNELSARHHSPRAGCRLAAAAARRSRR